MLINREDMPGFVTVTAHRPRVAFVCIHNSCRSQIAEAFARAYAGDVFDSFSAGTEPSGINPDVARLLAEVYGIDIADKESKHISCLPEIDIVVTMGCGVSCPFIRCQYREDWDIADPCESGDTIILETMEVIRKKILDLRDRVHSGDI